MTLNRHIGIEVREETDKEPTVVIILESRDRNRYGQM